MTYFHSMIIKHHFNTYIYKSITLLILCILCIQCQYIQNFGGLSYLLYYRHYQIHQTNFISNTGILCTNFYSRNLFVSVRFCNLYNNTFSNYTERLIFNRQVSSSILNKQFGKKQNICVSMKKNCNLNFQKHFIYVSK